MSRCSRIASSTITALSLLCSLSFAQYKGRVVDQYTGNGIDSVRVNAYSLGAKYSGMTNANGDYTVSIAVSGVDGNADVKKTGEIRVSGVEGKAQIVLPQPKNVKLQLFNTLGQEILAKDELSSTIELDTKNLSSGTYYVRLNIDGQERTTVLGIVNGRLTGYKPMAQIPITKTVTGNSPLGKIEGATIDSIVFSQRDIYPLTKIKPAITGTTIETIQVVSATYITVTAYGVNADSGVAPSLLQNAKVWIGTRNQSDQGNYIGSTDVTGKVTLRLPKTTSTDTLFIDAAGYSQRNILIDRLQNKTITEYNITDKVDLYFFETVFLLNGQVPLAKPDPRFGKILPFYVSNPLDTMWARYVKNTIEQEIARFSGGEYTGTEIADSAQAYTSIGWMSFNATGAINDYKDWGDLSTILTCHIDFINISNPTFEDAVSDVTKKEICNAIYGQYDIANRDTTKIPNAWKVSKWYQGGDGWTYYPGPSWTAWDLSAGRIAGKLPRGYRANAIHNPNPSKL